MPTPFYHLGLAEALMVSTELPAHLRSMLTAYRPAFLLGNTAADVQVFSGQPREATHFFRVPNPPGAPPPWEKLLHQHSRLRWAARLPAEQAVFWAGYLCHLQADWYWVQDLFLPVFGPFAPRQPGVRLVTRHDLLRAYLDRQILSELRSDVGLSLAAVDPAGWLPFTADTALYSWRDFLAEQLQPGGSIKTVAVFAKRAGMAPDSFQAILDTDAELERLVFNRLPRQQLVMYREKILHKNCNLLVGYLNSSRMGP
jgi:hypothetical protein